MKVLHVIDSAGLYGAEKILLFLMESQKKMELQPLLLSIGEPNGHPKDIEIDAERRGLEVHSLKFRRGLNLKGSFQILRVANSQKVDIIHSHGYKANILLGSLPNSLRRTPTVTTLHGWTSSKFFSKMGVYQLLDAIAIRRLDAAVAVSSAMLKHSNVRKFRLRPVVIENGLQKLEFEKKFFEKKFPALAFKMENKFRVLSVGRLSPEKGFHILIEAVASLVDKGIDTYLVLIGEGTERPRLSKLINSRSLSERVILLGYEDSAFSFMPFFDVFALSSFTEGLPVTILEAMQAGIPIVATGVGDIPTVLAEGQYGEIVTPGSSDSLSAALEKIYRNKEQARQRADEARKRALTVYGVDRMATGYMKLYERILLSKRKKSLSTTLSSI
jgi:glycosyltransferase involved in cell wall biosynthesis